MVHLGYICLFLALAAALYSAIAYILGSRWRHQSLVKSARGGLLGTCGLITAATAILLIALLTHNFQIEYVASYTSRDTSLIYLISSLWAGNDGSLLFWAWLLSIFAAIAVVQKRDKSTEFVPYAAAIAMLTESFFLILLLSVSNPFQQLPFVPADGRGLNPMLENPGMIFHPPLLLAGYVGLTIPFAFAIGALLKRKTGNEWLESVRGWTLLSWLLLGVGNIIGAWWAYVELGWGGYWAWDPVENAGLMPFLVATAFLHSVMMQRRGMFKIWNMVLIILAFNLAIFGTFLTRSGILSSVHAYAESTLGPFFSVFLGIAFFGSLGLLWHRSSELKGKAKIESLISRENTFLLNNLLLVIATFAILVGTIFPLISEAVSGTKISLGSHFFNQVCGPILLTIIFLGGICVLIGWRRASIKNLAGDSLRPLALALIVVIVLFGSGIREWYTLAAFSVCSFAGFIIFSQWFRETRARRRMRAENYLKAFFGLTWANRTRYGSYIVHLALIIIAVGVIGTSFYQVGKRAMLMPGESMTIKNYTITYEGMKQHGTQDKMVVTATTSVYDQGKLIGTLAPEKYFHRSFRQPVSEVAIRSTLREDLYLVLIGWTEAGTTAFEVLVNPLVNWIWIGGGIFLFGGLVALWPGRRKPVSFKTSVADSQKGADLEDEIEKRVQELRRGKGQFCPQCGAKCQEGDKFCSQCGTSLTQRGEVD